MSQNMFNAHNYLVPAYGTPRGYAVQETLGADPVDIDFSQLQLDGEPFIPSGFYADNSNGTADLYITINQIGFTLTVPAGGFAMLPYPAPPNQSVRIMGAGDVAIVFVDFPVIPLVQ